MYLRIVTTLLLVVGTAVAVRLWRPAVRAVPAVSVTGAVRPHGVWPDDPIGPDPVLEKRVPKVVIRADRLEDALRQFRQQAGVQIVWSRDDLPVMSGEPIRVEMTDVTVAGGLRRLMSDGLGPPAIGTRDGVVVIGHVGEVARFYNVRGLLSSEGADPVGAPDPDADPIHYRARSIGRLVGLIQAQVDPPSWRESGGHGDVTEWDGILIIRQSPENHRAIVRLLESLRAGREPPARASPVP
jgi:hypothetical protein